jgi:hypothetical protein
MFRITASHAERGFGVGSIGRMILFRPGYSPIGFAPGAFAEREQLDAKTIAAIATTVNPVRYANTVPPSGRFASLVS